MLALALLGCSTVDGWPDVPTVDVVDGPRIVASPGLVAFGDVSVNADGAMVDVITLFNIGDTAETITGHDEPIGSAAFSIDAAPILTLDPNDSVSLFVTYAPTTEQSDAASLLIEPSGETVRLTGAGTAPVAEVGSPSVDPVVLGCDGVGTVTITNAGSEDLELLGVSLEGGEYTVVSLPDTVAPGQSGIVELAFAPTGGGARGATLVVSTNDPLHAELGISLSGLGYEGERVTEVFRYTPSNPTDLIFVVSTGGGMTAQLDKAVDVIPAFVDTLRDTNIDYHLTALSGASPCPSATPGWVDRSDTSLQAETVLEHGLFGASGTWDDDLLGLAAAALSYTGTGGCLDGFRREDADLHVILLSDGPSQADAVAIAEQIADGVDAPAELRVSALLPTGGECGDAADDYAEVVEAYGGTLADLCASDWSDAFDAFAELPSGSGAVRYVLAEAPVASTIEVLTEGVAFTSWTWDAEDNAVVFDAEQVPALGAEVTVRYVSSVTCDG